MIGVDIVDLQRISLDENFVHRILTGKEQTEFQSIILEKRKKEYLAAHFACKEAIFKATQCDNYLAYSLLHDEKGKPYIDNHPEIHVSISHDGDYAIAMVVVTP